MKRGLSLCGLLLTIYVASGLYIVEGNQHAVIRRFGRLVRNSSGNVVAVPSGLHFDLPWPWARIDRVNLNEIRTLTIGAAELDNFDGGDFLQVAAGTSQSQFLTGDKNVLNLQIHVQYRVSEEDLEHFLYGSESAERRLQRLAEATAADLVSRSGVDFVHPLGLGELRELLTHRTRALANHYRLGVDVEEVAINAVWPPVRVKADFLDVSNARADKQKYVNAANAYTEQHLAEAGGKAQRQRDEAQIYARRTIEAARGTADRFTQIVRQVRRQEHAGGQTYTQARQLVLRRMYIDAMEEILGNVAGKVFLDSGKPVDLTIRRDPGE